MAATGCNVCACNAGMNNTGVGCSTIFKDTRGLIFVPLYANDGTRNGILLSATLNQAYFDALINNSDTSKRWYPIAQSDGLKDVESVRPEPVYQTATDGSMNKVRDGIKPFKGEIRGIYATPYYVGQLNGIICQQNGGFYKIDRDGNLIGNISADGLTLYPITIDTQSFNAKFVEATPDKNVTSIELVFNFAQTMLDQNLVMIACSELGGVVVMNLAGLVDVCATFSLITVNGFTMKLTTKFGTAINPLTDQGRVAADFISSVTGTTSKIRRTNNTPADVSVLTVTESVTSPGTYVVTVTAGTSADTWQIKLTKAGRDYSCILNAGVITVP